MNDLVQIPELMPRMSMPMFPSYGKHPLSALAETHPESAERIIHRMIDLQSKAMDVSARMSVFQGHTTMACEWLRNRKDGEHNIDIESGESGWLSRSFRTKVRIS